MQAASASVLAVCVGGSKEALCACARVHSVPAFLFMPSAIAVHASSSLRSAYVWGAVSRCREEKHRQHVFCCILQARGVLHWQRAHCVAWMAFAEHVEDVYVCWMEAKRVPLKLPPTSFLDLQICIPQGIHISS